MVEVMKLMAASFEMSWDWSREYLGLLERMTWNRVEPGGRGEKGCCFRSHPNPGFSWRAWGRRTRSPEPCCQAAVVLLASTSVKLVPDYEIILLADRAFGASLRHSEER